MIARYLLPLFTLVVPGAFGQPGLYGRLTVHLRAGDRAPDIRFAKILSAPGRAEWNQSNLTGKLTILIFYISTSRNLQTIRMWNALVDEFADKPVQFLFVSGEQDSTLLPWLRDHPIKGWVFHDPAWQTGKAYGLELPTTVFIGSDRNIIGFGQPGPPQASELKAALDGRITTTQPTRATLKAFLESGETLLNAEPPRMPRPDEYRPNFPPSDALHVSPSTNEDSGNFSGTDFKVLRAYTLKEAILNLYGVSPIRVRLPASLNDGRQYDFSMVLPAPEDSEKIKARFQQGLLDYFHLTARHENRMTEAYVLTATSSREPPVFKPEVEDGMGGSMRSSGVQFETVGPSEVVDVSKPRGINSLRGVWIDGTADNLCHRLEGLLDQPIVNETNLKGEFRFRVESSQGKTNDFLERLRDELGLQITRGNRDVEFLTFAAR